MPENLTPSETLKIFEYYKRTADPKSHNDGKGMARQVMRLCIAYAEEQVYVWKNGDWQSTLNTMRGER